MQPNRQGMASKGFGCPCVRRLSRQGDGFLQCATSTGLQSPI